MLTLLLFFQIHKEVGSIRKGYWCLEEWPTSWASQLYNTGMLLLVFIIPLLVMSFAYVSISKEMWKISANKDLQNAK